MDILGFLISAVVAALVIWVVSKLKLGLEVSGFVPAIISAIVIALVGAVVNWLLVGVLGLTVGGGWLGAIVLLIIAAIVLMISDRFVPGLKVKGFTGALIAALAIGVFSWLIGLVI